MKVGNTSHELWKLIGVCGAVMLVLYLFYRTMWVLTLLLPCMIIFRRLNRKVKVLKRKALLNRQFKDLLESLAASLRAGYAPQNALRECLKEMEIMHGEDSPIYQEVMLMVRRMEMGDTVTSAIEDMAERNDIEDIRTFSQVFGIVSRTGGDMVEIVRKSAEDIGTKIETRREIEVLISARKLEMNIMSIVPIGIILYMDLTTDGLLDPLYGNPLGAAIMTVCLLIYIASLVVGRRITDIKV